MIAEEVAGHYTATLLDVSDLTPIKQE